jgi:hypothetical protein
MKTKTIYHVTLYNSSGVEGSTKHFSHNTARRMRACVSSVLENMAILGTAVPRIMINRLRKTKSGTEIRQISPEKKKTFVPHWRNRE